MNKEVLELAWSLYEPHMKKLLEDSFEKYSGYKTWKHYDDNELTGAMIYKIEDGVFYCTELFIKSENKMLFRQLYKFWQTQANKLELNTIIYNDKLIKFLLKQGAKITHTDDKIITMEVYKHG